jgi:uncharacterized coiled-coil protein SlyX
MNTEQNGCPFDEQWTKRQAGTIYNPTVAVPYIDQEETVKQEKSAEEIKVAALESVGNGSFRNHHPVSFNHRVSGFQQGAMWMQSELQQRIAELEASNKDYKKQISELQSHLFTERRSVDKHKTSIDRLEADLKRKDEALKSIRNLQIRSDIHPSLQGDKAIEIAQEVLKMDKDGK